jgi:hypothetical protein
MPLESMDVIDVHGYSGKMTWKGKVQDCAHQLLPRLWCNQLSPRDRAQRERGSTALPHLDL